MKVTFIHVVFNHNIIAFSWFVLRVYLLCCSVLTGGLCGFTAVWCKIVSGNSKLTIGLVYRSPKINEEDNTNIQNAIKEISKEECIIMGDFNHGHIQWKSLKSTGGEDQHFLFTQHVLEPTGGDNVLDIVLSSQKELVDNVKIHEPLGNSDHNQIHFDINVKSESKNKKRVGEISTKVTIKI